MNKEFLYPITKNKESGREVILPPVSRKLMLMAIARTERLIQDIESDFFHPLKKAVSRNSGESPMVFLAEERERLFTMRSLCYPEALAADEGGK